MNTTEQLVESYFRICRECFTVPDVKVQGGYGRQFDLLAYCLRNKEQYHIEIQVSHSRRFALTPDQLFESFDRKFFGVPRDTDAKARPQTKSYRKQIWKTYEWFGFVPAQVKRLWICWNPPNDQTFRERLKAFNNKYDIDDNPLHVLSFQKMIIPQLIKHVNTAHYEDISLRTLSLLRQCDIQGRIVREEERQSKMSPE